MKITHYIIALLLCCCASAFARIGETEQQIEARYGKSIGPLREGTEVLGKAYRSSGLTISVLAH